MVVALLGVMLLRSVWVDLVVLLVDFETDSLVRFDVNVKAADRLLGVEVGIGIVGNWQDSYCAAVCRYAGEGSSDDGPNLESADGGSRQREIQRPHCVLAHWMGADYLVECTRQQSFRDSEHRLSEDLHWESRRRQKCWDEVTALQNNCPLPALAPLGLLYSEAVHTASAWPN